MEMASPEYQRVGQSFTGGCHKKSVLLSHWFALPQEYCDVGSKAEINPEENHS